MHHGLLYPIIENLIDAAIPLWNATLTTSDHYTPRVPYNSIDYEPDLYSMKEGDSGYPVRQKDESNHDYHTRIWTFRDEFEQSQTLLVPEPAMPMIDLNLDDKHKIDLKRDYKTFQVIVKLANIILTPETPEYEGGTWHVEGQAVSRSLLSSVCSMLTECPERAHLCDRGKELHVPIICAER